MSYLYIFAEKKQAEACFFILFLFGKLDARQDIEYHNGLDEEHDNSQNRDHAHSHIIEIVYKSHRIEIHTGLLT